MGTADGSILGVTKVVDHGPDSQRWNLAILSDGYLSSEMSRFHTEVDKFLAFLKAEPTFSRIWSGINVHRIDVASVDRGVDRPVDGIYRRTYFDMTLTTTGERGATGNSTTAKAVCDARIPGWKAALCWAPADGTASGDVTGTGPAQVAWTVVRDPSLWTDRELNVLLHELGHSAFGLADEYGGTSSPLTSEPREPNVTLNTNAVTLKWGRLLTRNIPIPTQTTDQQSHTQNGTSLVASDVRGQEPTNAVGLFEGGKYSDRGVWRASRWCRMLSIGPFHPNFCPVCDDAIRRAVAPYVPLPPGPVTVTARTRWSVASNVEPVRATLPAVTPPASRQYEIIVRDADGFEAGLLTGWRTLGVILRRRDVGAITVSMSAASPAVELLGAGTGLIVTENGVPIASGRYDHPQATMDDEGDPYPGTLTISAPDDLVDLRDRIVYPVPTVAWANQPADRQTLHGPAETLALFWIRGNTGTQASLPARRTLLVVPPTQARGRVVKRTTMAGENLLTVVQDVISADGLGIRALQGANGPELSVLVSQDKSAEVFFTYGRNNLAAWDMTQSCSDGNVGLAAGGEGAARIYRERVNHDSVHRWRRRVELFIDQRQTTDNEELTSALETSEAEHPDTSDLSLKVLDSAAIQYGRDYGLGDLVGVRIGAESLVLPVEEVQITVDQNGAQRRVVTLGQVGTGPRDRMRGTVRDVLTRVRKLETRI